MEDYKNEETLSKTIAYSHNSNNMNIHSLSNAENEILSEEELSELSKSLFKLN